MTNQTNTFENPSLATESKLPLYKKALAAGGLALAALTAANIELPSASTPEPYELQAGDELATVHGNTIWSMAEQMNEDRDVRITVDLMIEELKRIQDGDATLQAGTTAVVATHKTESGELESNFVGFGRAEDYEELLADIETANG